MQVLIIGSEEIKMASEGSSGDVSLEVEEKEEQKEISNIDELIVGMLLEAKDKFGKWFVSKILEIDKDDKEVKVHFAGWGSRFDEWIPVSEGDRLRTVGIHSVERYHKKKKERNLKVGDRVQTKWEDNKSYLGHILSIQNDNAVIEFDDGVQVTKHLSEVRKRLVDKVAVDSKLASAQKEASIKTTIDARRERAKKRRQQNKTESSSPPSSPLPQRSRRKKPSLVCLSDDEGEEDEEYVLEESDEEHSSMECDASDVSSSFLSPARKPSALSKTTLYEVPTTPSTKTLKIGEDIIESGSLKPSESSDKIREDSPMSPQTKGRKSRRKNIPEKTQVRYSLRQGQRSPVKTSPEDRIKQQVSKKVLGPLLTPPPHNVAAVPITSSSNSFLVQQPESQTTSLESSSYSITATTGTNSQTTTVLIPTPPETPMQTDVLLQSHVNVTQSCDQPDVEIKVETNAHRKLLGRRSKSKGVEKSPKHSHLDSTVSEEEGDGKKKKQVAMTTRTQTRVQKNIIKNEKQRPAHLAPKEHVVVWDHNKYKCRFTGCNKSFRKEILLQSHLKHYHNILSGKLLKTADKTPTKKQESPSPVVKKDDKITTAEKNAITTKSGSKVGSQDTRTSSNSSPEVGKGKIKTAVQQTGSKQAHSPRKTKSLKTGNIKTENEVSKVLKILGIESIRSLSKLDVPPEEKGEVVYKGLKIKGAEPSDVVKIENNDLFRQRGNLRPLRKPSQTSSVKCVDTESEETTEGLTEEEDEFEEEEEEDDEKRTSNKDDVVHCVCGSDLDEGFMIQCDQCLTWQHGECVRVEEDDTPDYYLCPVCSNPPGRRHRMDHQFKRDWFTNGELPTLPGGPEVPLSHRKAIIHSHKLADVLFRIKKMVHCSKIKLQAVRSSNHPYLKQWIKQCSHLTPSEIHNYIMKLLAPIIDQIPIPEEDTTTTSSSSTFTTLNYTVTMTTSEGNKSSNSHSLVNGPSSSPITLPVIKSSLTSSPVSLTTPEINAIIKEETEAMETDVHPLEISSLTLMPLPRSCSSSSENTSLSQSIPVPNMKNLQLTPLPTPGTILDYPDPSLIESEDVNLPNTRMTLRKDDIRSTTSVSQSSDVTSSLPASSVIVTSHKETGDCQNTINMEIEPVNEEGSKISPEFLVDEFGIQETAVFATTSTPSEFQDISGFNKQSNMSSSAVISRPGSLDTVSSNNETTTTTSASKNGVLSSALMSSSTGSSDLSPPLAVSIKLDESENQYLQVYGVVLSTPKARRVSSVVKELSERITKGEAGTWFHKLLLLDHIDQVQQKIVKWIHDVDEQIEAMPSTSLEENLDTEQFLAEVRKSISELQELRQTIFSPV